MTVLAEIASGEVDTADVLFLLAVIAAVLSAVAAYSTQFARHAGSLLSLAVGLAALAWLVL